jgi:hypothetical protein
LMARRMLVLFRPVAAAAAPRLYDMVLRTTALTHVHHGAPLWLLIR